MKQTPPSNSHNSKSRTILIGFVVSAIATVLLLVGDRLWGNHVAEYIGFGLLVGFSYAALCKK
ncbi:MAG TPA: hypothetical protein VFV52_04775 [Bacilli bacterium]|nr:hypothetical protein [Bacilli bacterium]